jgi:hypothetical protein
MWLTNEDIIDFLLLLIFLEKLELYFRETQRLREYTPPDRACISIALTTC